MKEEQHPFERLMHSLDALEPECVTLTADVDEQLSNMLEHARFEIVPADAYDIPEAIRYSVWRRTVKLQDESSVMQVVEIWASRITHVWMHPYTIVRTHPVHV